MILLNDYLYDDNTVPKIVYTYAYDLRKSAIANKNIVDLAHSSFLLEYLEFLEFNHFITAQSATIHKFYEYMEIKYPFLSFIFKGRIKSLTRAEIKYNAYIMKFIYNYHNKNNAYPTDEMIVQYLKRFSDLIAYRIVLNIPKCHLKPTDIRENIEIGYLYKICNELPTFIQENGFDILPAHNLEDIGNLKVSKDLDPDVQKYVKDYVLNKKDSGYQSLHLCLFDNTSRCKLEMQLRTKDMDDFAEIGKANHTTYEEKQELQRSRRMSIPEGECKFFDEAFTRVNALQNIDITKVHVNMFTAYSPTLINDQSGFLRGRLITPFEHLSRFQR